MHQPESYLTGPHGDEEKREGRTRALTWALNQQQATGLVSTLGLVAEDQIINTLKKDSESPLEPVQDVDQGPTTFAKACASVNAKVWEGGRSFDFQGIVAIGTFTLVEVVSEGGNTVDAIWVYKSSTDAHVDIGKAKGRFAAKV